ncbi:MAG: transporter, sugar porter family [Jatrophihabitans sp.]|nr:transporter, sugar porter family [Jatrophihabitans sp.]
MSSTTAHRPVAEAPGSTRRAVTVAAAITALGGLLFGYDTGVVSGALLFLKDDFGGLSSIQEELVTSLLLVGAAVGALAAGRIADAVGRRPAIVLTASIFIVGVLLAALARIRGTDRGALRHRPGGGRVVDGRAALHR